MTIASVGLAAEREASRKLLAQPIDTLFSHSKHQESFSKMGVSCTDCHSFAVKPKSAGPLSPEVPAGLLKAPRETCHQCHVERISLPRPNQCAVCHADSETIKPKDHFLSWRERHGRVAQADRDSCAKCHTPQSCEKCHSHFDRMNPNVHPGNFRMFHSIQARANPQSCVMCHKSTSFCVDCHTGRRFR